VWKKKEIKSIVLFCIGGGTSIVTYYIILYTLTEYFKIWYPVSAVIGLVIMYSINFLFQKFFTFKNKKTDALKKEVLLYFSMAIGLSVTNLVFLYAIVEFLQYNYLIVQFGLTMVLSIASYLLTKRIFSQRTHLS